MFSVSPIKIIKDINLIGDSESWIYLLFETDDEAYVFYYELECLIKSMEFGCDFVNYQDVGFDLYYPGKEEKVFMSTFEGNGRVSIEVLGDTFGGWFESLSKKDKMKIVYCMDIFG